MAVGAAGQNDRVSAVATIYGGLPETLRPSIVKLPPTLIVHGDADTIVPVAEAHALDTFATGLGAETVLAITPRAAHGFALNLAHPEAKDAFKQVTDFFATWLWKR